MFCKILKQKSSIAQLFLVTLGHPIVSPLQGEREHTPEPKPSTNRLRDDDHTAQQCAHPRFLSRTGTLGMCKLGGKIKTKHQDVEVRGPLPLCNFKLHVATLRQV